MDLEYVSGSLAKGFLFIALVDFVVLYGGIEGFGHFVVIMGIEGDSVSYHDLDLNGELSRAAVEFLSAWGRRSCKGVRLWKSLKK